VFRHSQRRRRPQAKERVERPRDPRSQRISPRRAAPVSRRTTGWWTPVSRANPSRQQSRKDRRSPRELFRKKLEALGIKRPRICFHSFWHTVGQWLEAAGLSEGEAARITGHAQKGITYGVYSTGPGLAKLKANVEALRYDDVPALSPLSRTRLAAVVEEIAYPVATQSPPGWRG
jgi:integrase